MPNDGRKRAPVTLYAPQGVHPPDRYHLIFDGESGYDLFAAIEDKPTAQGSPKRFLCEIQLDDGRVWYRKERVGQYPLL